jgi:hypothetical protein
LTEDSEFHGVGDQEARRLRVIEDHGRRLYFLDAPTARTKIEIIRLTEFLRDQLDLSFEIEAQASRSTEQRRG